MHGYVLVQLTIPPLLVFAYLLTYASFPYADTDGIRHTLTRKYPKGSAKGAHQYRCTRCNKHYSDFTGSVLQNSKLPKHKFILFVYLWVMEIEINKIVKMTGFSKQTCIEWNKLILEAIDLDCLHKPTEKIGGPGVVVEIDESKFGKRTSNVSTGRRPAK